MKLKNSSLEQWLKKPSPNSLKDGGDTFPFSSRYEVFKNYLENHLHKEVTKQAIYKELISGKEFDKIIWLNDHGSEHVKTVIKKASELLGNGSELNAREVFFLLNAIQVHDIGNFYGRVGHEAKVRQAIGEGLTPILFDHVEAKYITSIAQVHGGIVKYKDGGGESKNTISTLKAIVTSDEYKIRQRFLASILRFADELADDKYRADTKSLDEGSMPKGSEIFHAYASCLDTVKVVHEDQTVELHFKVPKEYVTRTFGKIQGEILKDEYLIDEIYKRALKVHTERIYCSKFWKKEIDIEKIWVQIEFYSRSTTTEELAENDLFVHNDITFSLNDHDYPTIEQDIFLLCPDLKYENGEKINGINVLKKINNNE